MARLTEEMVIARSKQSDLSSIKKLNCWGAELGDVSLLRRMPNVEVLAFSINKISGLSDFAWCRRLRELYVRKNAIADLREIRHLRRLPALASLWLGENPCADHPEYRLTVLRNLPRLEVLDNVPVQPEEVQEAARRGRHVPDSDDEEYAQEPPPAPVARSPERARAPPLASPTGPGGGAGGVCEGEASPRSAPSPPPALPSPPDSTQQWAECAPRRGGRQTPESDERSERCDRSERSERYERCERPAMTRSYYEPRAARSPERCERSERAALRHAHSAHSVQEYAYSNGEGRPAGVGAGAASPPAPAPAPGTPGHEPYYERADRCEAYHPQCERDGAREYPSAVMGERRGFPRRPVARNSNLLSAVLCLLKELDYPSLEVAELAVRCRMDELASAQ